MTSSLVAVGAMSSLTDPDGNPVRTNLRVSPEDLELLHQLGSLLGKA